VRIGVSGPHGTGKTTLVEALCARLPGHRPADEPYVLLEEAGYDFGFPPSPQDYRAQLRQSMRMLSSSGASVVFDRTPVDFLAYLAAQGADIEDEADPAALRSAFARLDLLVITPVTAEAEHFLPRAEMSQLRQAVNDTLLELVYRDPWLAWTEVPVTELNGPLHQRLAAVLAALPGHARGQAGSSGGP
jgi:predicted ATPase